MSGKLVKTSIFTRLFLCALLFSLLSPLAFADSKSQMQAKGYYFAAEESFTNGNYDEALGAINKSKSLLGSSNARISAMEIKILYALKQYPKAQQELDNFYSYQSSDQLQREVSSYLVKIEKSIQSKILKMKLEKENAARVLAAQEIKSRKQAEMERNMRQANRKTLVGKLVQIPAGSFVMGSNNGREWERPVHSVSVSSFKMQAYEVTWDQYQPCVNERACKKPRHNGWGKGNRPVNKVSWDDVQVYVKWLELKTGQVYRLPSESEWEYAARAGTTTKYSWGDRPSGHHANGDEEYGWPYDGYKKKTAPVGSFKPNAFGLYDMNGNVWEWVEDCWSYSYQGAPRNGHAWKAPNCTEKRVLRGGAAFFVPGFDDVKLPSQLRSASRTWWKKDSELNDGGFRLVFVR